MIETGETVDVNEGGQENLFKSMASYRDLIPHPLYFT